MKYFFGTLGVLLVLAMMVLALTDNYVTYTITYVSEDKTVVRYTVKPIFHEIKHKVAYRVPSYGYRGSDGSDVSWMFETALMRYIEAREVKRKLEEYATSNARRSRVGQDDLDQ